jgi:hypothetical protein
MATRRGRNCNDRRRHTYFVFWKRKIILNFNDDKRHHTLRRHGFLHPFYFPQEQ